MKKQLVIALLVTLATLFQAMFADRIRYEGIAPDLLAVMIIVIGADYGAMNGIGAGFAGGLVMDVLFGYPIGIRTIQYMLLGYAISLQIFQSAHGIFRLTLLTFLFLLLRDISEFVLLFIQRVNSSESLIPRMLHSSAYSALFMLPIRLIMRRIGRMECMGLRRLSYTRLHLKS